MKYLLVIAVVWIAIWIWRQRRREEMRARPPPQQPRAIPKPQAMLRCAHCGVHVPAGDAVLGANGVAYCSAAHRKAGEQAGHKAGHPSGKGDGKP
jgi:uncharacterized protein